MDIKAIQNTNFGWITDRAKAQLIPLINKKNTRIYKDAREKFNNLDKFEYSILDYNNDIYTLYSTEYFTSIPVKTKNNIYSIKKHLFEETPEKLFKHTCKETAPKREKRITLEKFKEIQNYIDIFSE